MQQMGTTGEFRLKNVAEIWTLSDLEREYGASFDAARFDCEVYDMPGPRHLLWRNAELRKLSNRLSKYDPQLAVSFVLGFGEDTDRRTSRIGGLPFWPSTMEWPMCQDLENRGKHFVGQFDFRNIYWNEALPGDILTVHFDEDWDGANRFAGGMDCGSITLRWHDSRLAENLLIRREDIPEVATGYSIPGPYYCRPILTVDYRHPEPIKKEFILFGQTLTLHTMKLGGHAPLFGSNWHDDFSALVEPIFLCSIGSSSNTAIRSGGMPSRLSCEQEQRCGELCWLDMGMLVIAYSRGNPADLRWCQYLP